MVANRSAHKTHYQWRAERYEGKPSYGRKTSLVVGFLLPTNQNVGIFI